MSSAANNWNATESDESFHWQAELPWELPPAILLRWQDSVLAAGEKHRIYRIEAIDWIGYRRERDGYIGDYLRAHPDQVPCPSGRGVGYAGREGLRDLRLVSAPLVEDRRFGRRSPVHAEAGDGQESAEPREARKRIRLLEQENEVLRRRRPCECLSCQDDIFDTYSPARACARPEWARRREPPLPSSSNAGSGPCR
jgi:hypothetical protein